MQSLSSALSKSLFSCPGTLGTNPPHESAMTSTTSFSTTTSARTAGSPEFSKTTAGFERLRFLFCLSCMRCRGRLHTDCPLLWLLVVAVHSTIDVELDISVFELSERGRRSKPEDDPEVGSLAKNRCKDLPTNISNNTQEAA